MSLVQSIDFAAIAPPLALVLAAVGVLVADLFVPARARLEVHTAIAGTGILVALVATALLAAGEPRTTFRLPGGAGVSFAVNDFTLFFWGLFLLVALGVLLLSTPYSAETRLPLGEYHFLLLASFTGMLVLAASRDLASLIVALEVVSLPAFALTALRRYDGRSTEAALKFFVVSVLSTALTLYGVSLVYGITGGLDFATISERLGSAPVPVARVAVVLVLAGFAFKVSAVPFHFWAPDTYQGAPVPVAAFLSTASKAAGFAAIVLLLRDPLAAYGQLLGTVLGAMAAVTMTLGNLVALRQREAIRLLAWSSIAQAGYILVPLAVAVRGTGEQLDTAVAATLAYLGIYAAMNLGAFGCVLAVARRVPRARIADFRGLVRHAPVLSLALAFFLLNLAGLPPGVAGLFGKIVVFGAAVGGGAGWLAVVMAVNTVIALYYYIAWAAVLFAGTEEERPVLRVPRGLAFGVAAATVVTAVLSVAPQVLLSFVPLAASAVR